ncbi:MAG TPA: hypothetical protein H9693_01705 [Firmicutes bacterium]|nr:hypothetical protein [Bacillota bacterium]
MVIIQLEVGELEEILAALAETRGITMDRLVSEIVNKYFPAPHSIDKSGMAEGYKEMGEINLSIADGIDDKKR